MKILLAILLCSGLLQACGTMQNEKNQPVVRSENIFTEGMQELPDLQDLVEDGGLVDAGNLAQEDDKAEKTEKKETRLFYPAFEVLFHNFRGYEVDKREYDYGYGLRTSTYSCQFGGGSDYKEAVLNDDEQDNEDYVEGLKVLKDTLHISEQLFDDRINNTLIQVIPKNKNDRFKLSFCYLSTLHEIIDDRGLTQKELEARFNKTVSIDEQTRYYPIRDSATFFFRAMPHTPDMVAITVKDDKVVPVKQNAPAQLNWEQKQAEEELLRIKKKYQLRDTLVVFPGEYETVATLTRNKKLFSYGYDAFLFRLERLNNKKLMETKYIVVSIGYGCLRSGSEG